MKDVVNGKPLLVAENVMVNPLLSEVGEHESDAIHAFGAYAEILENKENTVFITLIAQDIGTGYCSANEVSRIMFHRHGREALLRLLQSESFCAS